MIRSFVRRAKVLSLLAAILLTPFFVSASYAASPVTAVAKYGVMLQNGPDPDFQTWGLL